MIERLIELLATLGAAVRVPIVVGACGLAIGWAAFWATSVHETQVFSVRVGVEQILRLPGTDPITGQPYGLTYISSDAILDPEVVTRRINVDPPPAHLHQAIPVPVGTAVGILVILLARSRLDRRRSFGIAAGAPSAGPAPS